MRCSSNIHHLKRRPLTEDKSSPLKRFASPDLSQDFDRLPRQLVVASLRDAISSAVTIVTITAS